MKVCILGYTIAFKLFIMSNCLDSSNECVEEDNIIVEDLDDSDDHDLVDPTHVTEAYLNPGVVIDKLITVIVAFLLKFRIVYNISNCAISAAQILQVLAAFNWLKLWDSKFKQSAISTAKHSRLLFLSTD